MRKGPSFGGGREEDILHARLFFFLFLVACMQFVAAWVTKATTTHYYLVSSEDATRFMAYWIRKTVSTSPLFVKRKIN